MGNSIEISCLLILPKKTAFVADSHIDCDQSESNYTFPWCCLNDRCGSLLKYTKEEMPLERLFRLRVLVKKLKRYTIASDLRCYLFYSWVSRWKGHWKLILDVYQLL